jgi:DNA primase
MYALTEILSELLDVPINERGINAMLRCPFHEDNHPSFSIHLEDGVWNCFGCGESGSLEKLYRRLGEKMDDDLYLERAKRRAEEPEMIFAPLNHLSDSYAGQDYVQVDAYLASRNLPKEVKFEFSLGWCADKRAVSMPYINEDNNVTGIKYRHENGFKSSETGSKYGLYNVQHAIGKDRVIICEGESDTQAVWARYGDDYGVCGTSGASVSDSQWHKFSVPLFFASKIYLAYDADEAGDLCVETAMRVLGPERSRRIRPPDGNDVSEYFASGGSLEEIGL